MLESIIQFLNLELSLLSYFEKRHCLSTLVTTDKGEVYPAEYIGEGNYNKIDFDAYDGVSYFRLTGQPNVERIEQKYTPKPRVNVSFPLRLVYAVRKSKLSADDAYSFDRVRTSIAKQLESDAQDLVATLKADRIEINTGNYNFNAKEVWDEETAETGQYQPRMDFIFASMDVDVIVTIKNDCIVGECDGVSSDILQAIDFCLRENFDRLTQTQKDCISNFLCGTPDPATVRNSDSSYSTTVASGATLVLPDITVTDSDGSTSTVPSVQDVTCTPCPVVQGLTVDASTTTPALGDSVTITATPTNITPTSYTFYLPKIDGSIETVTQAGNSYVWTAEGNGAVEVTVSATDGSDTVHSCVEVTVDFPFVADDHTGMSFSYGLFKAASAYSGNCFQVQRSSDGAYLEVGWVNGCVADLASLRTWAGADEVKVTIWYDSTGNGNHLVQATAGEQVPISNYGGIQLLDNGLQFRDDVGFDMTSGGTNTPIGAARIDLYTVMEVRDFTIGIYTLFNRRTNSGFMMIGQSGSGANAYSNFGTPSYYVDGSAIGTTRGDVYTALYQTGVKQVSVLDGDTTNGDWSIEFRIGELDFNTHWVGTQSTLWAWVTDTSSIRSTIEGKINALQALDVD